MRNTTSTGRELALARYMQNLTSGRVFQYGADSFDSADRMNYKPMLLGRTYGDVLAALGEFARNDRDAATASEIVHTLNRCGNVYQALTSIYRALGKVSRDGWHDTATASGPEPGRPSTHQHSTELVDSARLAALAIELQFVIAKTDFFGSTPCVGWALRAVLEDLPVSVTGGLPNVNQALGR